MDRQRSCRGRAHLCHCVPGAGKSAVRRELRRRGIDAVGTDEDGIAAFFDFGGHQVDPVDVVDSAAWRSLHTWRIVPERLHELVEPSKARPVFVCGSAAVEGDVWSLFRLVIGLVVDDDTLRRRLATRTGNNYGKAPTELELAIGWNQTFVTDFESYGAILLDATQPVTTVVDQLLEIVQLQESSPQRFQLFNLPLEDLPDVDLLDHVDFVLPRWRPTPGG